MSKRFFLPLIISFVFGALLTSATADPFYDYQEDADLLRLEHLEYWTALFEEYHKATGRFPFQDILSSNDDIAFVKIATKQQLKFLDPGGPEYREELDFGNSAFNQQSVKDLVAELEHVLKRIIDEKYDMQQVPTNSPIGYYYFATDTGYVLWVTCITCGVTLISTLLFDGHTPTVNIASEGMVGNVTKALSRSDMLSHPTYKKWKKRPYHKEGYARQMEAKNAHDSKS